MTDTSLPVDRVEEIRARELLLALAGEAVDGGRLAPVYLSRDAGMAALALLSDHDRLQRENAELRAGVERRRECSKIDARFISAIRRAPDLVAVQVAINALNEARRALPPLDEPKLVRSAANPSTTPSV